MFGFDRKTRPVSAPAERWDCLMGTIVQQQVYGIGGMRCAERASHEIERLERLWNSQRSDSELRRLEDAAGRHALPVASETLEILQQAQQLHETTGGALDVTAGPLIRLWQLAAERDRLPSDDEVSAARALVDIRGLELADSQARLARAGQMLDLGAIGKGYAADRCTALYRSHGIRHALIDFGGNVAVVGNKPDGTAWRIGIQTPSRRRGEYFGFIEARDCAVVTSGSYERQYEIGGMRYSHIIDPRTAQPVDGDIRSVTVMHRSALLADAVATASMVLGATRALALARALALDALIVHTEGTTLTNGMKRAFHAQAASA
jgi:thiamine biosynthesis lipoprotein